MQEIKSRVHTLYWNHDLNCAKTTLICLSEHFGITLDPQILNAATGMNGGGRVGGQCGLVEGALMFIGILGHARGMSEKEIVDHCGRFSQAFVDKFGSMLCRDLRPGGFQKSDPPHLCENLTVGSITFALSHTRGIFAPKQ